MILSYVMDTIPCLDIAKMICTVNLSEPVEITSTDYPNVYKY